MTRTPEEALKFTKNEEDWVKLILKSLTIILTINEEDYEEDYEEHEEDSSKKMYKINQLYIKFTP